ncbi:MAG: pilus assembly protein [Chloroflexi bacterium]|nr:pilus assembly protein [Chloroflexota bacterium]
MIRRLSLHSGRPTGGPHQQRGQALVELAIFFPILLLFGLACFQFVAIFLTYADVMRATRDATRWVAIHPHATDTSTRTMIDGRLPSGLTAANLTMTFSPSCTSLSSGKCASRPAGTQISVTSTYNVASKIFLPTSFSFGQATIQIPTTLPAYTMFMQVEPG